MNKPGITENKILRHKLKKIYSSGLYLPLLVLVITLALTYQVWLHAQRDAEQALRTQFDFSVRDTLDDIQIRMKTYEQVMRGVDGLFSHAATVERNEFRDYVAQLQLKENYPGIQGIRFVQLVSSRNKSDFVASVRNEGLTDYNIHPASQRDHYAPVLYIEPFDVRNQRVFGYDMLSSREQDTPSDGTKEQNLSAMEQARDTGKATLSGRIYLLFETAKDTQAGFLMFLPVYKFGAPHETVAERRTNITGWICSVFRMGDLMGGVLGHHSDKVSIEIHDGDQISSNSLMYESDFGSHLKKNLNASYQTSSHVFDCRT